MTKDNSAMIKAGCDVKFINSSLKGVGTPREAPKNVFWDVSVFSSDSGREMIVSGSSKH